MPAPDSLALTATLRGQFPSTPAQAARPSRRERTATFLAGAAVILPSWLAGAWYVWAEWVTLGLALLAFGSLFTPVFDYRAWPPSPSPHAATRRLARFPIFWLGLAILAYGALAALNPWLALTGEGTGAWLEVLPAKGWLPRSLETPFWDMNAWRVVLMLAPAWLVTCAIWAGVETAGSLRGLLTAVALNGALLAVFGLVERVDGTQEMFWVYDPRPEYPAQTFFGSFVFTGHAAAWLLLALGAIMGCCLRAAAKGARERFFWAAGVPVMLIALGCSSYAIYFFLAMTVGAGGMLVAGFLKGWRRWWPAGVLAGGVWLMATAFWAESLWVDGGAQVDPYNPSLQVRYELARTSVAMIPDELWWGWGPGSYRYAAPYYLRHNPLFSMPGHPGVVYYRSNFAHSDWVQFPIEWGLAGTALFTVALGWWGGKVWRLRRVLPTESWCALGAVALVLAGAAIDFPLASPAVLLVMTGLLTVSVKLGETSVRRTMAA